MCLRIVRFIVSKLATFLVLLAYVSVVILGGGYRPVGARSVATPPFTAKDASQFNAKIPVAWFELAYSLVRDEALSPPIASRIFGYLDHDLIPVQPVDLVQRLQGQAAYRLAAEANRRDERACCITRGHRMPHDIAQPTWVLMQAVRRLPS